MSASPPIEILLVEDNPGDVLLTREALGEGRVPNRVTVARDGVEALAMLRRQGAHAAAPRPDLILLDLNLPLKDGREVLEEIKADSDLQRIPILILTTSKADPDVRAAYQHHANSYLVKPVDLEQFVALMRAIESFWLSAATLPPR
jgi:chemotaxis family two-component system response regulator Rcp1